MKNFIRYALACEYTRTPLRRDEISRNGLFYFSTRITVVLEGKHSRFFAEVFDRTQDRLEAVFRMKLVELPAKERHQTVKQQRRSNNFY